MRLTAAAKRHVLFRSNIVEATVPAPVGGWDAISAFAKMPEDRAIQLDNFIPRPGWIEPRRGYQAWGTGMGPGVPVETIMSYYAGSTVDDRMFAVAGDTIYDVTHAGPAMITTVTSLSSARCEYENFTNSSNVHYQIVCNGVNIPKIYNGSVWADTAITGVTQNDLVQPCVYNGRLWFTRVNSLVPVYLDIGAIAGAAHEFPIGNFAGQGGYLQRIATWSVDTRQTVNDYLAFITSRGQVIVYVGTDPASSDAWQLVGVYNIGRPLGRRCAVKIAGDLAIITIDGITSMNEALIADRSTGKKQSITERILGAINDATSAYGNNWGWQIIAYDKQSLGILNIPVITNDTQMQFVMNALTGAWCRFPDINANVWQTFNDIIFFGGNDGTVYQWDIGSSDNGANISCTAKSAFNYFGDRAHVKRYTMLQPVITSDGRVIPGTGINVDFGRHAVISAPQAVEGLGPLWDVAVWDDAIWPDDSVGETTDWITVSGLGHCVSVVTTVVTADSNSDLGVTMRLNSWQIMYERGGPL
jgi:hypothetical protein